MVVFARNRAGTGTGKLTIQLLSLALVLSQSSAQDCTEQIVDGEYSSIELYNSGASFTGWTLSGLQNEGLEVRAGGSNIDVWEWALGAEIGAPSLFDTENREFVSGQTLFWRLTLDAAGRTSVAAYLSSGDRDSEINADFTLTWHEVVGDGEQPLRLGEAIQVSVAASPGSHSSPSNVQVGEYIEVTLEKVTVIGGATTSLTTSPLRADNDDQGGQNVYWYYVSDSLTNGFHLDGSVTVSTGASRPDLGSRLSFFVASGNIAAPTVCDGDLCSYCSPLAFCDVDVETPVCECPAGLIGNGYECRTDSWAVTTVLQCPQTLAFMELFWPTLKEEYVSLLVDQFSPLKQDMLRSATNFMEFDPSTGVTTITVNALFEEEAIAFASDLAGLTTNLIDALTAAVPTHACTLAYKPQVYSYVGGSTEDPTAVLPSGLRIREVSFDPTCLANGCWVIDVVYTTGSDAAINTLFLPRAESDDSVSSPQYRDNVTESFLPSNFPCQTDNYMPDPTATDPPEVTLCCLPDFMAGYRLHQNFHDWVDGITGTNLTGCDAEPPLSTLLRETDDAILGQFEGMPLTRVTTLGVINDKAKQYAARFEVDEQELRSSAGMRRGTVGIEYTVDTFIGLAQFIPIPGMTFDDPYATQQAIHLEKTDLFTVSVHGVNDYTFIDDLLLRLHEVRLTDQPSVWFLQVSFTLSDKYSPNGLSSGIIPFDSVQLGLGTKRSTVVLDHICTDTGVWSQVQDAFASRLDQDCAPNVTLCSVVEPEGNFEDQFVVINIPISTADTTQLNNWGNLGNAPRGASVFVDFVVSAVDRESLDRQNPLQMKTTVNGQIPVVRGGFIQWCDSVQAATDLLLVAQADLVVGSASSLEELSRLRVFSNISSSALSQVPPQRIDTDSIEAGLMTLVVRGNADYFANPVSRNFKLELEDLITVHLMEEGDSIYNYLQGLLLAGTMFDIEYNRQTKVPKLQPSAALLAQCSFGVPRASFGDFYPQCVVRRDVSDRGFPAQQGSVATAMELPMSSESTADAADFMQSILGSSDFAAALGSNYSRVLADAYSLNGQYLRAWWINPGYEWVPGADGTFAGAGRFQVSQRIVLFALIGLDEGFGSVTRRMLLASGDDSLEGFDVGFQAQALEFAVNPTDILMQIYQVDRDQIGTWQITRTLTDEEACIDVEELRTRTEETLDEILPLVATPTISVQIGNVNVDFGTVRCPEGTPGFEFSNRRAAGDAIADMEMIVVFEKPEEGDATDIGLNLALLQSMYPSIVQIVPVRVNENIVNSGDYDFRPDEDEEFFQAARLSIIIGGVGAGVLVCCLVGFFCYRKHKKDNTITIPTPEQAMEEKKQQEEEKARGEIVGVSDEEEELDVLRAKEAVALRQMQEGTYEPPPPGAHDIIHGDLVMDMNSAALAEAAVLTPEEHEAEAEVQLDVADLEEEEEEEVEEQEGSLYPAAVSAELQDNPFVAADRVVMNALSGAADGDVPAPPIDPPRRRAAM